MSSNNILEVPTREPQPSDTTLVRQTPLRNNLEYLGHHLSVKYTNGIGITRRAPGEAFAQTCGDLSLKMMKTTPRMCSCEAVRTLNRVREQRLDPLHSSQHRT